MSRTIKCHVCGKIELTDISEQEMWEEYVQRVGVVIATMDEVLEVCNECYQIYKSLATKESLEQLRVLLINKNNS